MTSLHPTTVRLSAAHRAALEAHRIAFALRSESEAVRHLVENYAGIGKAHAVSGALYPAYPRERALPNNSGLPVWTQGQILDAEAILAGLPPSRLEKGKAMASLTPDQIPTISRRSADISPSQYPEAWTFVGGGGGGGPAVPPTVTLGPSKPIPGSRLKKEKTK